jgi:FdhD protein
VSRPTAVTGVRAIKVRPGRHLELPEHLATEEPMQILLAGPGQEAEPLAVTMRTPGHDFELATGFVLTEGVAARHEFVSVDYCEAKAGADPEARWNHVTVRLNRPWTPPERPRNFVAASSCGTCGKATLDDVEVACGVLASGTPFEPDLVPLLPERLRAAQKAFERTGGLHAAGLFDRTGDLRFAREDVGRHNAVDKVVGATLLAATPADPADLMLVVSGRVSFEIVQKAAVAGLGVIAAVSAPSSLAVSAAQRLGVTIAAFVRGDSYNVYTHPQRLGLEPRRT